MKNNQRRFTRLGHYRTNKSGKKIFIKPHIVVKEKKTNEANEQT